MPKTQKIVHTVCTYCGVGCDVAVALEGEQIKRFFAKEGGKVSRGKLCIKGKEGVGVMPLRGHIAQLLSREEGGYWLTMGRTIAHYNNGAQTKSVDKLMSAYPNDILLVSHEDAKKLDMKKPVVLVSKYGESGRLIPKEHKGIKKGTLYTTFHHISSRINYLFGEEGDEITKTSRFKAVKVEIKQ